PHATISVHVRMNIDEYEVAEDHSHRWICLRLQQFEKLWHQFPHGLVIGRDVHRSTNVNRTISKACELGGLENAGSNAWAEQLRIPCVVVTSDDDAGILSGKNRLEALLHPLEGLPVASRG